MASYEPESSHRITLTAEQREAAHAAGVNETEYAKQLLQLRKAKRAGLIRD